MKESKQTDLTVNRSIEKARELDSVTGLLGESVKALTSIHPFGWSVFLMGFSRQEKVNKT